MSCSDPATTDQSFCTVNEDCSASSWADGTTIAIHDFQIASAGNNVCITASYCTLLVVDYTTGVYTGLVGYDGTDYSQTSCESTDNIWTAFPVSPIESDAQPEPELAPEPGYCLLYTSDAADE